jgi:hypothetical protein
MLGSRANKLAHQVGKSLFGVKATLNSLAFAPAGSNSEHST